MKRLRLTLLVFVLVFGPLTAAWAQGSDNYGSGLKVPLNEDGSKYFRLITWHQFWMTSSQIGGTNAPDLEMNFLLRRSRLLMYAQLSKRFLILTHFGLNSMSTATMGGLSTSNDRDPDPTPGRGYNGKFFMHDAWVEYMLIKEKLYIGAGLHYWNGVSRLTSQSTLNFLTLDAPLTNWFSIGTSDQFARHLGLYLKGQTGRFDYRFAINEGLTRPLFVGSRDLAPNDTIASRPYTQYRNFSKPGGSYIVQGYVNYQFFDKESSLLPYYVGTYLGSKKVFNIGAGFYSHLNGTSTIDEINRDTTVNTANTFAVDAFLDLPFGDKGSKGAITAYAVYYLSNWGENYSGGLRFAGTGNAFYGQIGYLLPKFSDKVWIQPYVAATVASLDAWEKRQLDNTSATDIKVGTNFFLNGHHSRITLEYFMSNGYTPGAGIGPTTQAPQSDMAGQVRLQLMIYL